MNKILSLEAAKAASSSRQSGKKARKGAHIKMRPAKPKQELTPAQILFGIPAAFTQQPVDVSDADPVRQEFYKDFEAMTDHQQQMLFNCYQALKKQPGEPNEGKEDTFYQFLNWVLQQDYNSHDELQELMWLDINHTAELEAKVAELETELVTVQELAADEMDQCGTKVHNQYKRKLATLENDVQKLSAQNEAYRKALAQPAPKGKLATLFTTLTRWTRS